MADTRVAQRNTSPLSWWSNELTNMVAQDYAECGLKLDEYSKKCAMAAMSSIYQLVKSQNIDIQKIDASNLREIVGQCASLKLNANAVPRECYFQLRSYNAGDKKNPDWRKKVEMGIEGDGNDAILRNFGENVEIVYPVWVVREGDEFTYPKHKGIEVTPPEWERRGVSQKVERVVYPVKLKDGKVQYLIADRESVKTNLFAHVRNNLTNETFGLVKGGKKTKYDATEAEKAEIDKRKEVIYEALRGCKTVDDMLTCPEAKPYISAAWLDTPESMMERKMRNNAIKKFPKNYDAMANRSFLQMDETYREVQEEIEANANKVEFIEITEEPAQPEQPEPEPKNEDGELPPFMVQE